MLTPIVGHQYGQLAYENRIAEMGQRVARQRSFMHANTCSRGGSNRQAGDRACSMGVAGEYTRRVRYTSERGMQSSCQTAPSRLATPRPRGGAPPPHAHASPPRPASPHPRLAAPLASPPAPPAPLSPIATSEYYRLPSRAPGDPVSAPAWRHPGPGVEACPAITAIWTRAPSSFTTYWGTISPGRYPRYDQPSHQELPEHHPRASVIDLSNARVGRDRAANRASGGKSSGSARRSRRPRSARCSSRPTSSSMGSRACCARARDLRRRGRRGRAVVDGSGEIARDGPHERGEVDPGPCGARREYRYDADPHPLVAWSMRGSPSGSSVATP